MDNNQFLTLCYERILGRAPDSEGFGRYLAALDSHALEREQLLIDFLSSNEFAERLVSKETAEFVKAGHYYSAIPSLDDKLRAIDWGIESEFDLPGIELNWDSQWSLLEKIKHYLDPHGISAKPGNGRRYGFDNPSFGSGDALFLQAMMRHFRPKQIVEVGSGYSSAMMLDVDEHHMSSTVKFDFVEPYPNLVFSLLKKEDKRWPIHPFIFQNMDIGIFQKLCPNDMLFIDSSHVLKAGSDVFYLFFEVLPVIQPGVLIHIHDILWPFEYPAAWLKEGRAWNESYILRAFLQYNKEFSIKLFPNALVVQNPDWFKENAPEVLKNAGGSLWITRNERS
jgi:predicted O-methyltransferase YrrM